MKKIDKQKTLWLLMILSLGILLGSLFIYLDHSKQPDPYDLEVLKNNFGTESSADYSEVPDKTENTGGNEAINGLEKGVTVGKPYSGVLTAEGSKNLLIIGEDKASNLYDTIGIASIDRKSKALKLIMFPRDTYIEYNDAVLDFLSSKGKLHLAGNFKLNYAYCIGAMLGYKGKFKSNSISFLAEVIKEKFGVEADDYIKINTQGFAEAVNLFGGIDINVPYDMNYDDPTQDLHIHISKGLQHLDGVQAEGFVRFRQGYREDGSFLEIGDIERKKNQISFLKAFINQHGTIANVNKVPGFLNTLAKNVKHSIGFDEILLNYTGIARDMINDKYKIESVAIDGENKSINGSSYVVVE